MYLRTVYLRINLRLNNIFCCLSNFAFLSPLIIKSLNHKSVNGHLWYLYLVRFNFSLVYYPGCSIGRLNTLFRCSDYEDRSSDNENIVILYPELLAIYALEEVKLKGLKKDLFSKIWHGNRTRDQEKPMAKVVQELQQLANKMVYSIEWSNVDSLLYFWEKIYIPWNPDLRRHIITLCHDTKVTEYPRHWKTLELVF